MQLWQQQLMYKKLQEFQGQQRLQQIDQGAREKKSLNHSSVLVNPAACLPRVMNELPINDTSNMWQNNFVGGIPIAPNNSQVLIAGNMNWAQESGSLAMHNLANGDILTDNQSDALKSMGFTPQQLDQSFYGMPVSSNRCFANRYSQLFGMSGANSSLMTKAAGYQTENLSDSDPYNNFQTDVPEQGSSGNRISDTAQNFQGKGALKNNPVQILSSSVTPGNCQQENHMQHNFQFQHLHGRQKEDGWSSNLQERLPVQAGISASVSTLDPTEEKLLFGTDDGNWAASFQGSLNSLTGFYPHKHPSQSDYIGEFPSVLSGSWSALMQEAVQASSSDQGVQEEWSGLSYQKTEQAVLNHSDALINNAGKQMASSNDSNLQNASSSTSRAPILSYDSDGNPNSYNVSSFQHTFECSHDESNRLSNETPDVSFHLSSGEVNKTQFIKNQAQKQYLESCLNLQIPVHNGIWEGNTYDQKENNSQMQLNSQNVVGRWPQQEMHFSTDRQHNNGPNAFTTSYQMVPGEGTSCTRENDSNMKILGASHDNLSGGKQPFKSENVNSPVQREGSLMGNFGSIMNSKIISLTQATNPQMTKRHHVVLGKDVPHDACVSSQGNEDMRINQTQSRMRLQNWEKSNNGTNRRLSNTCDSNNKNAENFSGEDYASSLSNHVQETNSGVTAEENLTSNSNHNVFPGNQNYSYSIPRNVLPNYQGLADVVRQGSRSSYVRNSEFEGHEILNNPMDVGKRFAGGIKELQPTECSNIHASSGTFNGITAQSADIKLVSQSRQNIEFTHMVEQSRDSDQMNAYVRSAQAADDFTASCPPFNQPSTLHGAGWFSLQSQKQPLPNFGAPPQTSLINPRQRLEAEAGKEALPLPNFATVRSLPHVTSQLQTWRNSSGQEHKGTLGSHQPNVLHGVPYDLTCAGNQLLGKKKQYLPGAKYQLEQQQWEKNVHGGLDQTDDVFPESQANSSKLVNNDLDRRERPVACNEGALDRSAQTSLPIPSSRFLPSQVAPLPNACVPAYRSEMDRAKTMRSGLTHVKSPGQQIPVMQTTSSFQSPVSGLSQQAGFSKMLNHVWKNLSAQQRLTGFQSDKVPSNTLKSIMNEDRDTSPWGLQNAGGQGNQEENTPSEVGTSSVNSQDKDHLVVDNCFTGKHPENADSVLSWTSQGQELVRSNIFDGGSNASSPSLLQHQQDVEKGKSREDSGFHSQVVHAPAINLSSPGSDFSVSEHTSIPSEYPVQRYSLLHQMQAVRSVDSGSSMALGDRLQGADIDSNASQEQSAGQRLVYKHQNFFNNPTDGNPGAVSKDNENYSNISYISEPYDLLCHTHSVSTSSSSNLMRGNEHYKISPQMNSTWFKKFIKYKNNMTSAEDDGNTFPEGVENSSTAKQRIDSSKFGNIRQSTLAMPIASNETSDISVPPIVMGHGRVFRSKKRKSTASELLPWHKEISQGQQRLQNTSLAELAWAQVANRLIEKAGDEVIDNGPLMLQARRRLIIINQMMQQLLSAVPASTLKIDANSAYESVTYHLAKSTLADACSCISFVGRDSCVEDVNLIIKKVRYSEAGDQIFSRVVEEFSGRSNRLEREFSRLEKRTSMLDVRLECQELEKFSAVNHLVKFHGRSQTQGVEGSFTSMSGLCKTWPQRYVTAVPVSGNLPENVVCLSL